jgi:hypothetical protein
MGLKSSFTTVKGCVTLYWELKPTLSSSQYFLNPIKSLWPGVFQNKTQINQMYLVMRVDTPNMGTVACKIILYY